MSVDPKDERDRVIDDVLASVVRGEPRRIHGAAIREAAAARGSSPPAWLAVAAAVLIAALASVLTSRTPVTEAPIGAAQSTPSLAPVEVRPVPSPGSVLSPRDRPSAPARSRSIPAATTTEPLYEGLPRLTIASIELPEPLLPARIDADPLRTTRIEITPLSFSTLSIEQEHN